MKNNKKGLSTIVATLLIILLTLVAVGIIWIVIRNVVQSGTDQVDIDSKCLAASVEATRVVNNSVGDNEDFQATIVRNGGDEALGGVKLVFTEADGSSNVVFPVAFDSSDAQHMPLNSLEARTITNIDLGALNSPNKVSVVVYFLDSSGNEQLCSTANQLTF